MGWLPEQFESTSHRHYDNQTEKIQALTEAMEMLDAFVDNELPTIRHNLELGMTAPSTIIDQAGMVALLIGCFPNTNKEDRSIFMQQLTLFLEDFGPSAGQLALTFRWLVRHCKFLPVIAEVHESLIEAENFIRETYIQLLSDPQNGTDGIRGYRSNVQYLLDDATGEAQRKRDEEWERQRIERERKAKEEKIKAAKKARIDAEENYQAVQKWAEDTIPRIQSNPKHSPERKAELIEQVNMELEKARKKVEGAGEV